MNNNVVPMDNKEQHVSKYKTTLSLIKDTIKHPHPCARKPSEGAKVFFEKGVLASKFLLFAGLAALSFQQEDVSFIGKHPSKFLGECAIVGLSAALPTAYLAYNRNSSFNLSKMLNAAFIALLVFFIFNIFMEMSGVNNSGVPSSTLGDTTQQNFIKKNIFNKYVYGTVFVIATVMAGIALVANDSYLMCQKTKIFKREMALFGIVNALVIYLILSDRGVKATEKFKGVLYNFLGYAGLYAVLQTGGFFDHMLADDKYETDKQQYI